MPTDWRQASADWPSSVLSVLSVNAGRKQPRYYNEKEAEEEAEADQEKVQGWASVLGTINSRIEEEKEDEEEDERAQSGPHCQAEAFGW